MGRRRARCADRLPPQFPDRLRYVLEVRHKSWLGKEALPRLLGLLKEHGVALCLVQHAWMPHLDEVTAPFVYIRWLGRREDIPTTTSRTCGSTGMCNSTPGRSRSTATSKPD